MSTSLRLLASTCCLMAAIASPSALRRTSNTEANTNTIEIADTNSNSTRPIRILGDDTDDAVAFAIADSHDRYVALREDYLQQGCVELLGDFPSAESVDARNPASTSSLELLNEMEIETLASSPNLRSAAEPTDHDHMAKAALCNCGLIYDLAASAILRDDLDMARTFKASTTTSISSVSNDRTANLPTSKSGMDDTTTTQLDAWVMARTANTRAKCVNNKAAGFPCKHVDLVAHLPLTVFETTNSGVFPRAANDIWGWTADNGKEFVVWGVREGHYFFRIEPDETLQVLGYLPGTHGNTAIQHDMKILGNYCYLGAEAKDHGMQIFDMRRLLSINSCQNSKYCRELSPDRTYTGTSSYKITNSHNIVTNPDNPKYVYVTGGGNGCNGGLHVVDVSNPLSPKFVSCFGQEGYVHDAQCVYYEGPDAAYKGKEICFCFNGKKTWIVDVTSKTNMKLLSSSQYNQAGYTHQGWLSSDHSHLVFGDEADELRTKKTRTLVQSVSNLKNPGPVREFLGPTGAIDHNQYVVAATAPGQLKSSSKSSNSKYATTDLVYQANYEAGLGILQVLDYTKADLQEIAYFDTYPLSDSRSFHGAWSSYPYFQSGLIAISSIEEGIFLVRPDLESALLEPNGENPQATKPPTQAPTQPPSCNNGKLAYKGKPRKSCQWVGRRQTKRRCLKPHRGGKIYDVCRKACAKVGLGPCANKTQVKTSNTANQKTKSVSTASSKIRENIFDHA